MPGEFSQNVSFHVMRETGGYGVIPDATGAAGLHLAIERGAFPVSEREMIQRNYATGRGKRAPHRPGRARGALNVSGDLSGFPASEIVSGQSLPVAETAFEIVLRSLMGDPLESQAGAITAAAAGNVESAVADPSVSQLLGVYGPNTNGGQLQVRRNATAATPFGILPVWGAVPNPAEDVIVASRTWRPRLESGVDVHADANADSFTGIYNVDGRHYFLPGCRPTALSFVQRAGEACTLELGVAADSRTRQQAGALPAVDLTNVEPAMGLLAPLLIDGTSHSLDVSETRFELGPQVTENRAQGGANGRSNMRVVGFEPSLRINPLNATVWEDYYDQATVFQVLALFGGGALANGRLNCVAVWMEHAQVTAVPGMTDDEGLIRQDVEIKPADGGSTGVDVPLFQIALF